MWQPARHPGLILLEVVLSLTLFILAVVMVGASVRASMMATQHMAQQTRGLALAQSVLSQIRAGYLTAADNAMGDFGAQFPDCAYKLAVSDVTNPVTVQSLRRITVTVTWKTSPGTHSDATDSVSLTGWEYSKADQGGGADASASGGNAAGGATGGSP